MIRNKLTRSGFGLDLSIQAEQAEQSPRIYEFKQEWLGKHYEQKRVEVIYVSEEDVVVTVTVYVFYGKWEG